MFDVLAASAENRRRFVWSSGLAAAAAATCAVALSTFPALRAQLPGEQTTAVLTVLTAAVAVAAGFVWRALFQISADSRMAWGAASMFVYGLVAVPFSVLPYPDERIHAGINTVRVTAHIAAAVLTAKAARAKPGQVGMTSLGICGATVAVILVAAGIAMLFPEVAIAMTSSSGPLFLVGLVGAGAGLTFMVIAARDRVRATYQVGLGVVLMCLAHLWRLAHRSGTDLPFDLTFMMLRALGISVVLASAVRLSWRTFDKLAADERDKRAEIEAAEADLGRMSRRNGEIRDRMSRLAQLSNEVDHDDDGARRAVAGTLGREIGDIDVLLTKPR